MNSYPLDILLKATALLILAALVDHILRRRGSAATRHFVWSIAMAGLLVLPVAAVSLPPLSIRIPVARPAAASGATADATRTRADSGAPAAAGSVTAPRTVETPAASRPAVRFSWAGVAGAALPGLYVAGFLVLLIRLAREPFVLRRVTRGSREVRAVEWQASLARCAGQLGIERRVRLLRSDTEVMPMTFGTWVPTIVLPASAEDWTDDRRRAVLLHELAHIARHDCAIQRVTAMACALYWPHPGVWWAARRQRIERELACDDRVLTAGAGAREYAGHLLDLAHSLRAVPAPATALAMARARQLEARLLAVLDAARNRGAFGDRKLVAVFALAMAGLLPIAALRAAVVPIPVGDAPAASLLPGGMRPAAAVAPGSGQDLSGSWEIQPSREPGSVQLTMRTEHWSSGHTIPMSRLEGLRGSEISGTGSVHFVSRRDAGTFTFDGTCRNGYCGGAYGFAPNQAFAAELSKRGFGAPTPPQQYQLALADVGTAFLDELNAQHYDKSDLDTLVRAVQHGVDASYVHEMGGLGYHVGTVDALIRLRDHGVDPGFARGMAENGYAHLSVDDLLRARDHGADPRYIAGMKALGYSFGGDLSRLIQARDHGIDPEFAHGLAEAGFTNLSFDTLMVARDHGIDPDYVHGMAALGYPNLTIAQLLRARDHGVDPDYVRALASAGYKNLGLDDLVRMRDHGVDAEYVRRIQQRGAGHPTVEELIQRRDRGADDPDQTARQLVASVRSWWRSSAFRMMRFDRWLRS